MQVHPVYVYIHCGGPIYAAKLTRPRANERASELPKQKQEWGPPLPPLPATPRGPASFFQISPLRKVCAVSCFWLAVVRRCPITKQAQAAVRSSPTKWHKFTLLEFRHVVNFSSRKSRGVDQSTDSQLLITTPVRNQPTDSPRRVNCFANDANCHLGVVHRAPPSRGERVRLMSYYSLCTMYSRCRE